MSDSAPASSGYHRPAAGIHALIVGVGGYPNLPPAGQRKPSTDAPKFGLGQIETAASAAYRLSRWLKRRGLMKGRLDLPLASCRVLLSPTAGELARSRRKWGRFQEATLDHFREAAEGWRR